MIEHLWIIFTLSCNKPQQCMEETDKALPSEINSTPIGKFYLYIYNKDNWIPSNLSGKRGCFNFLTEGYNL